MPGGARPVYRIVLGCCGGGEMTPSFTIQQLHLNGSLYAVIQPSGSRVELPPLVLGEAQQIADWLSVIAADNPDDEESE